MGGFRRLGSESRVEFQCSEIFLGGVGEQVAVHA
jgi:hypothetical protein